MIAAPPAALVRFPGTAPVTQGSGRARWGESPGLGRLERVEGVGAWKLAPEDPDTAAIGAILSSGVRTFETAKERK